MPIILKILQRYNYFLKEIVFLEKNTFTRLVIEKLPLFRPRFNNFASKSKKVCFGGYLLIFLSIKRQRTTN